jgi:hypothetical protein
MQCERCGRKFRNNYRGKPLCNCPVVPCPYLGEPIQRNGVGIQIKCACGGNIERFHTAYKCQLFGRCLPSLRPVDPAAWNDRKPESDLYHLCHSCDRKPKEEKDA